MSGSLVAIELEIKDEVGTAKRPTAQLLPQAISVGKHPSPVGSRAALTLSSRR